MFESRPWQPVGLADGPVPASPVGLAAGELLAWARQMPVSGAWLDALLALDPGALPAAQRLDLAVAWERVRRGVDAAFTGVLGSVPARACRSDDLGCGGGPGCAHDWSREDTAAALGIGPRHAAGLLGESRELRDRLPGVLAAVAAGTVSMGHARRLASRTVGVEDDRLVRTVAAHVLPMAASRTVSAFDRLIVATLERLRGPLEALAAHERARRRSTGISPCQPMADGMAGALLVGPAQDIARLFAWARQFTRRNRAADDPRTVGERRLDALLAGILNQANPDHHDSPDHPAGSDSQDSPAASQPANGRPADGDPTGGGVSDEDAAAGGGAATGGGASSGGVPGGGGVGRAPDRDLQRGRVALQLVLSAETLLGRNNDPGWLEGHGQISAALARQLAMDPVSVERLLVHPVTGELLDLSPAARFPQAALARYVRTRDRTCTAPGCGAQAAHLDLDHITEFTHGGKTIRINLHPVCERHHRLRHAGGWTVQRAADGTETWTDPAGRSYATQATSHLPPPGLDTSPDPGITDDWDPLEPPPPRQRENEPDERTEDDNGGACPF